MSERELEVNRKIELMIAYLKLRLELRDYHGVMDAAADLRELEVELRMIRQSR